MFCEIAYEGYNQVAANKVCKYLDSQKIKYRVRVKNGGMFTMASFVKNKVFVTVKKDVLTDANRNELTEIFNSYENYK